MTGFSLLGYLYFLKLHWQTRQP